MKISRRVIAIVLIFCAVCWAFAVAMIAKLLQQPDPAIIAITIPAILLIVTLALLASDIKKSAEVNDENPKN